MRGKGVDRMDLRVKKNAVQKRTDRAFRKRAKGMVAFVLCALFVLGVFDLGNLMIIKGDEYRSLAQKNQLYDQEITAVRGTVYDSNMTPLVTSSSAWILTVDPKSIYDYFARFNIQIDENTVDTTLAQAEREEFCNFYAKQLAKILGIKKKKIYELLITNKTEEGANIAYKRIKSKINATQRLAIDELFSLRYDYKTGTTLTDEEYKALRAKDDSSLTGHLFTAAKFFEYENDTIRIYPDNNFASTLIGVTNYDGNGVTGVELQYNSQLRGVSGRRVTAKDAGGNAIDSSFETVIDPQEGNGVVLTIDSNIQMYLENALSQALENTGAKGTYGIVMDVDTGAVLAISNKPDFDLNDPYKIVDDDAVKNILAKAKLEKVSMTEQEAETAALYSQWNSFCITSTYEPGSTFKIFTAAAALEEGVANLSTTYTCTGGYNVARGVTIHCANTAGHGTQTFTQGLMNSCNPFFINLGQKLGSESYYKYFEAFGFTEKTGIDLPSEASSVYHSLKNLKVTELASTSFGQSFRISPIQLITAACAIANGGKLMQPYVVDSIVDSEGNIISKKEPTVRRQVISESTAATVRNMMEAVVEGGTGKNAYIPGYRVAGKTATSEKLDQQDEDNPMKYVASFVCFAPADDPEIAILVGVDEPPGQYRGGGVLAAPIAKEIMEATLKYLNVEPQYTQSELEKVSKTAPNLIGQSVSLARQTAANSGLSVKVIGNGDGVISQIPSANQSIPENGIIVVYTEDSSKATVVKVPDFSGMTASQANKKAHEVGINIVLSGPAGEAGAVAYNQSVAKSTEVSPGTSITVYFHTTIQEAD